MSAGFSRRPPPWPGFFAAPPALAFGFAPRGRFGVDAARRAPAGAVTTFDGRSATATVRCAVRFTTRNARPIGAGRIRFCDGPWFA